MGLKVNGTLLAAQPQRYLSCAAGQFRQLWDKTDLRNQSVGEGILSELAILVAVSTEIVFVK